MSEANVFFCVDVESGRGLGCGGSRAMTGTGIISDRTPPPGMGECVSVCVGRGCCWFGIAGRRLVLRSMLAVAIASLVVVVVPVVATSIAATTTIGTATT